ncbi:MAG: hypothetical protein MUF10_00950 [Thermoanaerobaculaceae bacterium]|jgi:hypothetical protein|nr:hypothetical protein [Thermoanaerobaculaceae bacterium]
MSVHGLPSLSGLLGTHTYLAWALAQTLALAVGILICPEHRRAALRSALLAAPFGLISMGWVPGYWQPVRLASWLRTGPEDVLSAFATGGLIWLLGFATSPACMARATWRGGWFLRGNLVLGVGLGGGLLGLVVGLSPLAATALGTALVLAVFGRRRPFLLGPALRAALALAVVHGAILWAILGVWPGFLAQWHPSGLAGIRPAGVPLSELIWAALTGLGWVVFIGTALDLQPPVGVRAPAPDAAPGQ